MIRARALSFVAKSVDARNSVQCASDGWLSFGFTASSLRLVAVVLSVLLDVDSLLLHRMHFDGVVGLLLSHDRYLGAIYSVSVISGRATMIWCSPKISTNTRSQDFSTVKD